MNCQLGASKGIGSDLWVETTIFWKTNLEKEYSPPCWKIKITLACHPEFVP